MKKVAILLCFLTSALFSFSQNYRLTWGDEIKLKKGTADMDIVAADKTGLYFSEQRIKRSISVGFIGGGVSSVYKLYKFDKNFSEVFDKDYRKDLKGLDFNSYQTMDNDLFLFATDYIKKDKLFKVYGAKVDKTNGDLVGDFAELGSYQLESKKDDYEMKVTPIQDGKAFLIVSNISNKDRVSLGISVLDKKLARQENTVINFSFAPHEFDIQDVQYTRDKKIVVLGKQYEEVQIGKRKRKRRIFKEFTLSVYSYAGVKEKDIVLNTEDKFIIGGQLIQNPDGSLLLAGFYSNTAGKSDLNGFFINKVDASNGQLVRSSFRDINANMLGKNFDDSDKDDFEKENKDDDKKDKKKDKDKDKDDDEDDDVEELPNDFIIRSVTTNPADGSIIITSEISKVIVSTYTTMHYNSVTHMTETDYRTVYTFSNKDILVVSADEDGQIKWLNDIPKSQREVISSPSYGSGFYTDYTGYFAEAGGMPYYSSYSTLMSNGNFIILLNDHASNNVMAQYGDKVKSVYNFKKSNLYGITIDMATGKMTRKLITPNNSDDVLTPRHAYVVNNEVFIPSLRMHSLAKSELKFAKLVVK